MTIHLRFPCTGNYALGLFVGDEKESSMHGAANFMINCVSTGITPQPYPLLYSGCIGRDLLAEHFGVQAESHAEDFVVKAEDGGHAQIAFELSNTASVDLLCELHNNDIDPARLSSYCTLSTDKNLTTFDIHLPVEGEYGFNVFARKVGVDFQIFHVFTYLIVCTNGSGAPIKPPDEAITMETAFTADDMMDIRVPETKGPLLLSVAKKTAQNHFVDHQITAKKEGDITVYEVDLPTPGEYIAVGYKLKNGVFIPKHASQLVRLEPLQGDTRPIGVRLIT
jgi:hypothetical protein